jgi:hypothetical protein
MTKSRSSAVATESDQPSRDSAEAERGVLGALLLDSAKAWPLVKDVLAVSHFVLPKHRTLYATIAALIEEGGTADSVLVIDELQVRGQINAVGQDYIADLVRDCPSALMAGAYAKRIRKSSGRAEVIDIGTKLQARARLGDDPADAARLLAEEAERIRREYGDAPEPKKADRRPLRWAELAAAGEPAPRQWRISHWLPKEPTLMAGQGGVGKSLLAQTIATALALGRSFLDEIREPSTVLMWACEDDHDELWRRQVAICKYFDVPLDTLEGRLILEPRRGLENTLYSLAFGAPVWTPLRAELASQVADYGADVLFLDNIAQTYGANENDRHQATTFVNGIIGLVSTPVILGHPAKAAGSEFSGSTAWENAVRMRWYMGYQLPDQEPEEGAAEDPNVRFFAKRKTNYSEKDFRKLTFENGLFVPEVKGPGDGFADRWGGRDRAKAAEDCVLNAIETFVTQGIRVTDGKTSPDYLPKKMREGKLAGSFTPKELSGALAQLRISGRVTEGPVGGRFGNRTQKFGLVVAP